MFYKHICYTCIFLPFLPPPMPIFTFHVCSVAGGKCSGGWGQEGRGSVLVLFCFCPFRSCPKPTTTHQNHAVHVLKLPEERDREREMTGHASRHTAGASAAGVLVFVLFWRECSAWEGRM